MKALKTYLNANSVIAFHIYGGGGNRRRIKCLGEYKIGDFTDDLFEPENEGGEYRDDSGNGVGLTEAEVRSGIGCIDIDGDYDTIYTKRLGDIKYTDEEAYAMAQSSELSEEWVVGYFCNGESDEKAKAIIGKLGLDVEDYFESELEQLREYLGNHNYTEAIYVGNGDTAFLEFSDDILESMEGYINDGYTIREGEDMGLEPYQLFMYLSKEDREWAQDAHLLVADKYNSARGYYLLK